MFFQITDHKKFTPDLGTFPRATWHFEKDAPVQKSYINALVLGQNRFLPNSCFKQIDKASSSDCFVTCLHLQGFFFSSMSVIVALPPSTGLAVFYNYHFFSPYITELMYDLQRSSASAENTEKQWAQGNLVFGNVLPGT